MFGKRLVFLVFNFIQMVLAFLHQKSSRRRPTVKLNFLSFSDFHIEKLNSIVVIKVDTFCIIIRIKIVFVLLLILYCPKLFTLMEFIFQVLIVKSSLLNGTQNRISNSNWLS